MLKNPGKVVCQKLHHKRTTDGSDLEVIDPNECMFNLPTWHLIWRRFDLQLWPGLLK